MTRCPKCESNETLKIKFYTSYGLEVIPAVQSRKLFPKSSKIFARACVKCGHIFDLTLENPEKLAPFVTVD